MQCSCGGITKQASATRKGATLEFRVCKSCGRTGAHFLYVDTHIAAVGAEALAQFREMTGGEH